MRRRDLLASGLAAGLLPRIADAAPVSVTLPFANGDRPLVRYPQKRPLIRLTARPPQLETPFEIFDEGLLTPNDAFFVRYHLAGLPLVIDAASHRLSVTGLVTNPLTVGLADLKRDLPQVEVVAVNQCSGNSRGFSDPRVAGGQLGNGAMGNARWRGTPLKALLERAGVAADARFVTFGGADRPPASSVPAYVKALPLAQAMDGEVMLAWAMNGRDLPFLNGYPLRLVVPGHYGTYWVKHLDRIALIAEPFEGYWMKTAYRIPDTDCACVAPGAKPESTRPIGRLNVRSFVTSHADGAAVPAGRTILRGIAFDGGSGIARVLVSLDGGDAWREAELGRELSRYGFRGWRIAVDFPAGGHAVAVKAISRGGETQPETPRWQPAGYMRNVIETIRLRAA